LIDIEELLPKILATLYRYRISEGGAQLKNMMSTKMTRALRHAWNVMKDETWSNKRSERLLKTIINRHESKAQYGSMTRTF
jgi:hypothetical protein